MMNEINAQLATLSPTVQLWMNWMTVVFVASLIFVWKHTEARWTLAVMVSSMPGALAVFALWQNVHLFGIVHLVLWAPLLVYLVHRARSSGDEKYERWAPFRIWTALLMATVAISLLFDVRDLYLVLEGTKALP